MEKEAAEDCRSNTTKLREASPIAVVEQFRQAYTLTKFELFQEEVLKRLLCNAVKETNINGQAVFIVAEVNEKTTEERIGRVVMIRDPLDFK